MNIKSFLVFLILVAIFFVVLSNYRKLAVVTQKNEVVIELTDAGFIPNTITIKQGTTVVFRTKLGKYFWPASNPHPVHDGYPEFDPKRSLGPSDLWSFRFNKVGTWGYHDHLAPNITGSITVVGQKQENKLFIRIYTWLVSLIDTIATSITTKPMTVENAIKKCNAITSPQEAHQQCWTSIIRSLVLGKGIDAGLRFIREVKNTDIAFATECHVYAHAIGELAYERLKRGNLGKILEDTGICNLGYFHGFMQEYVSHEKDLAKAKKYCEEQGGNQPDKHDIDGPTTQCFHGIGHGLAYWHAADPSGGGKISELVVIKNSIAGCMSMLPQPTRSSFECVNGVYGAIAAFYFTLHGFDYTMRPDDLFWVCKEQPEKLQKYCYDELVPAVYNFVKFDFVSAGQIIEKIKNHDMAIAAMEHLGWMPAHRNLIVEGTYAEAVKDCHQFPDEFTHACLRGVVKSLINFGNIEEALPRAVRFCQDFVHDIGYKEECQNTLVEQIKYSYPMNRQKDICTKFSGLVPTLCESL